MTYEYSRLGNLGIVSSLIGGVTAVTQTIADVVIQKEQIKAGSRLSAKELQHRAMLAAMGQDYREKELASKMSISKRRDTLFRDLALYVGLGLGVIAILTAIGTFLIKKKGGG